MSSALKKILQEYEYERNKKQLLADHKKQEIYSSTPRLEEIDSLISKYSIDKAKKLLQSTSKEQVYTLDFQIKQLKEEKNTILKSIGVSPSDFLPEYTCKKCNDTGYISEGLETQMCSCLKQRLFDIEYNKFNVYNMQNQTFQNFSSEYYSDEINKEKYNSNISPRQNMELIKNICISFIDNFNNPIEKNLLFTGNSGLGKTFLSSCIANELLKQGNTILYQTAPVMLDTIINYRLGKSTTTLDIYNHLLNVDLLIIDDLGTENMNSMKFAELFTIINSRLLPKKNKITKTIISTNLSIQNLSSLYGERIISRFVGNYNICYFFGDDIRFKRTCT